MDNIDIKSPVLLIVICLSIGGVIGFFTDLNWLTTGLVLLAILLLNGLMMSTEDRQKGGFDYDENESQKSKVSFRRAYLIQISFLSLVILCAIISVWSHQ
ncbi:MAG: hypothetical protein H7Z73_07905 [Candidatus Saccharibacteria bacterium]|nr:hypothetical protein [Moraxellaceae bacterium]